MGARGRDGRNLLKTLGDRRFVTGVLGRRIGSLRFGSVGLVTRRPARQRDELRHEKKDCKTTDRADFGSH